MASFVYFAALFVLCGTRDSFPTTTSPQQQNINIGDTTELREVQSWICIASFNENVRLNMRCKTYLQYFSIHQLSFGLKKEGLNFLSQIEAELSDKIEKAI